jgi:hypothetical protein
MDSLATLSGKVDHQAGVDRQTIFEFRATTAGRLPTGPVENIDGLTLLSNQS